MIFFQIHINIFRIQKKKFSESECHEKPNKEPLTKEFSMVIQSLIQKFSARFTQFKEFEETLKFYFTSY